MGKLSVLFGNVFVKLMVEVVKVLELVKEVVCLVFVVEVFVVVVGFLFVELMKKLELLLKEYFFIVDLNEVLLCV